MATKKTRITSVRNGHGIRVRKMCASCQHKSIDNEGTRICGLMQLKVKQKFCCKQWLMSEGLMDAGKSGGVVKKLTEIVIR